MMNTKYGSSIIFRSPIPAFDKGSNSNVQCREAAAESAQLGSILHAHASAFIVFTNHFLIFVFYWIEKQIR